LRFFDSRQLGANSRPLPNEGPEKPALPGRSRSAGFPRQSLGFPVLPPVRKTACAVGAEIAARAVWAKFTFWALSDGCAEKMNKWKKKMDFTTCRL